MKELAINEMIAKVTRGHSLIGNVLLPVGPIVSILFDSNHMTSYLGVGA